MANPALRFKIYDAGNAAYAHMMFAIAVQLR